MRLGVAAEPERLASAQDTVLYLYEGSEGSAVGLVSQPTVGARARSKGNLYVVVSAAGGGAPRREAAMLVADAIRQHYYYDESAGIGEVLEKAVRVADQRLRQQHERFGVALGSVSVAAAVVRDNELYLTTIGEALAYLLRQARLLTLPDEGREMALPTSDGHVVPPVWHGEVSLGDTLALGTNELARAVGVDEVKNAVVTLHPQPAAEHLHNLYVTAGADGADVLLILEATEVPATAAGRPLIPVRAPEPYAAAPERSPIPLADTVTEQAAAIGGAARQVQDRARRGLANLLGRAQDTLPKREAPQRRITPFQSRIETQRRLALAILALLGVVVLVAAGVYFLGGQSGGPGATISSVTEGEQALAQARAALDRVFPSSGTSMVERDPAQARRLLLDAITALDRAQASGVSASTTTTLRTQALGGIDTIDKVRRVTSTEVLDLGTVVDAPDVGDLTRGPPIENAAYVIDKSTKTLYRIDIASGAAKPILVAGKTVSRVKVGNLLILAHGGRDVLALDDAGNVWRWRPADAKGAGTLALVRFGGKTEWGDDVIDIATFDRSAETYNLYVLDPSEKQVLRYSPAGDGSSYPTDPAGYLSAATPVDDVRQMFVDGDLYFLLAGDVQRYQSGQKTTFELTLPPDTDVRPRVDLRLFAASTARRAGVIEVWDAANGRVIEFSKRTGEYIQQFLLAGAQPQFSDVRGLFIVEPPDGPPALYWTTGTKLFTTTLTGESSTASPSAAPSPTASPKPSS
jgi:hypothetical protein